jgi:hypothetical protein
MRKILAILLLACSHSFAIGSFTYFWTISLTGDTATVTKWRANNDSVLAFATRVTDTINNVIPRWSSFSNHDSLFRWMNIDTIRGNTDIDSLKGLNVIRGNPDIDSISGSPKINAVTILGTASVDSLVSTKGAKAPLFAGGKGVFDSITVGGGDWIGKIVIDTGHTGTGASKTSISLPSGLTSTNCIVLSYMINAAGTYWGTIPTNDPTNQGAVEIIATNKYSIYYQSSANYQNQKYRVAFMVISK